MKGRLVTDLPEHFACLYRTSVGKFETPLDSMGIADIDATFELAIRTYPNELPVFESTERNRHHLYWTEEWWKALAAAQDSYEDRRTVQEFRKSPPQIAYVPKVLHRHIEAIMIPPPAPDIDVMRRRNDSWASASILLKSAVAVEQARVNYKENRDNTRRVLGHIAGITPLSRQRHEPFIYELDAEYWLSELESRLKGWREAAELHDRVPVEDRIIPQSRLVEVRNLRQRLRYKAIVPRMPEHLIAA